jgi:hypothetical protein
MHERYKNDEAKFYLARMEESLGDRQHFRYYLSAFLSSARSVLQYALKELGEKGRQDWYDRTVAGKDVLQYFKDKRDVNIHEEPVNPSSHIEIAASQTVAVFDAVSVMLFNEKAPEKREPEGEPPPPKPPEGRNEGPQDRAEGTVRYYFDDWPGSEDVIVLSHRYIAELEKFVQSGMKDGILLG